jgi:peptide/nickel transport system substrate-binding protein
VRQVKTLGVIFSALVVGALILAACSSSTTSTSAKVPTSGTKVTGGTVTWAELPSTTPNFIYPFMPAGFFSVANISQFQYMMYRPLYWFGSGGTLNTPLTTFNESLSLASAPVYSNGNKTVSFTLKDYNWSDGEKLTTDDVMEWMNIWHAEKSNWAAYVPNVGMPDDISSVSTSGNSVTINLTGSVNPTWFTYNMLSQITPLPQAWDVTSSNAKAGSGGCSSAAYGTADSACSAVWTFMTTQAGYNPAAVGTNNSLATYATNKLWQVVDGPWKLSAFNPDGQATFVPNTSYSGPVKPSIDKFEELPYTDESAEYNALLGGSLTMGYLPIANVPGPTSNPFTAGPNAPALSGKFYMVPFYGWSINYFPYNFSSTGNNGDAGKIFSQLYFRQAMQMLIDQPLIIQKIDKGYGVPVYGPVPNVPENNPFVSPGEKTNPYPYDPSKAMSLLKSHGWKVVPNGVDTCTKAGSASDECGAGIPSGAQLNFDLQYATGITTIDQRMSTEQSAWSSAGIKVNLSQASFDTVIGNATACSPGPSCTWQLENWGAGWIFSPDYYPTGEEIFSTGALSNYGSYSDSTNDANIKATNTTTTNLYNYEDYLSKQLPVVFQDDQATYLWEINNNLRGVVNLNSTDSTTPENFYFVK